MAGQDSGTTLMDLITADPSAVTSTSSPSPAPTTLGKPSTPDRSPKPAPTERKSKKGTLMQIQSDTVAAAKALNPVRTSQMKQMKKKPVSYAQLARSIHELAATADQKSSQKQLVNNVFPKLAVYNSVDPSLAPSLIMLHQQCEDRNILRYVYYYLARILSDSGAQGLSPGGGIPTPNGDALADIDAVGGVTRADVIPRIVNQLTSEALNTDAEFHARRLAALKALTAAPASNSEVLAKLYEIVFGILEKVADSQQKRKKAIFSRQGGDKEDIQTRRVLGGGCEINGLYYLKAHAATPSTARGLLSVTADWHRRLSHPPLSVMKSIYPLESFSSFQCESCLMSKHVRSSHHVVK